MPEASTSGLKRGLSRNDLTALIINGIIGAGIFGMPAKIFGLTGIYSIFALVFCSFLVFTFILCMSEVSSRFTSTGGPYLYANRAFGPMVAFEVGWLMWLARIMGFSAICNLLITYATFFVPALEAPLARGLCITAIVMCLVFVNFVGVKKTALVSNILIVAKLIPLLLLIVVGFFFIDTSNFKASAVPAMGDFSKTLIYLIFAFSGFEVATIYAGEVINPRKNFPPAFFTALSIVAVIYICIQVVCIGTLPDLISSKKPLADAATVFMGSPGGAIITFGALLSMMGTLNATVLGCSRLPFAMAESSQLPGVFKSTHNKYQTPWVSIVVSGSVILVASLTYSFIQAVTITVIIKLLTFGVICVSLPVFRKSKTIDEAKFKAPWGLPAAGFALAVTVWLVSSTSLQDITHVAIAIIIGLGLFLAFNKKSSVPASETSGNK